VKFISPFGTQSDKVIKFAITIAMDPSDIQLRSGLSATADINVYNAKNVLLVPVSVITTTPEGTMVTVINEATGQLERRRISLGLQNFQFAEVLSGLKEGEKIQMINQEGTLNAPITQQRSGSRGAMRILH